MGLYYKDDSCTIYHGDCREILPTIDRCDLLVTDPPYIVEARECGLAGSRKYLQDITAEGLDQGFDYSLLERFTDWVVFCGKQQLPQILNVAEQAGKWMLVTWCKTNPTPLTNLTYLPDTEYFVHKWSPNRLFGEYRDKSRFIVSPTGKSEFEHPTVKPIAIMKKCIRLGSQEGECILDPFMGSGSTLLAAKLEGRKAIGIEINERYCEMAANRLRQQLLF